MFRFEPRVWDGLVDTVCRCWEGTPYRLNGCIKGRYVDCVHFAGAVLDELYGFSGRAKDLKSLPADACIHNRRGVWSAFRRFIECYPHHERVRDGSLESGDIVVFGLNRHDSTASHLLVAGSRGRLWEASMEHGVRMVGYRVHDSMKLIAVYRATDKEVWTCSPTEKPRLSSSSLP